MCISISLGTYHFASVWRGIWPRNETKQGSVPLVKPSFIDSLRTYKQPTVCSALFLSLETKQHRNRQRPCPSGEKHCNFLKIVSAQETMRRWHVAYRITKEKTDRIKETEGIHISLYRQRVAHRVSKPGTFYRCSAWTGHHKRLATMKETASWEALAFPSMPTLFQMTSTLHPVP